MFNWKKKLCHFVTIAKTNGLINVNNSDIVRTKHKKLRTMNMLFIYSSILYTYMYFIVVIIICDMY